MLKSADVYWHLLVSILELVYSRHNDFLKLGTHQEQTIIYFRLFFSIGVPNHNLTHVYILHYIIGACLKVGSDILSPESRSEMIQENVKIK